MPTLPFVSIAYPQSGGNETPKRTSICCKNEKKLCVDNISLCDESKSSESMIGIVVNQI